MRTVPLALAVMAVLLGASAEPAVAQDKPAAGPADQAVEKPADQAAQRPVEKPPDTPAPTPTPAPAPARPPWVAGYRNGFTLQSETGDFVLKVTGYAQADGRFAEGMARTP